MEDRLAQQSLTAPERETVITFSDDADELAYVWTAQRRVITKLRANPSAELVTEGTIGTTGWAEFRLPARLISFRTRTTHRSLSIEARQAASDRLAQARAARVARVAP
jgi:hypothetical protein